MVCVSYTFRDKTDILNTMFTGMLDENGKRRWCAGRKPEMSDENGTREGECWAKTGNAERKRAKGEGKPLRKNFFGAKNVNETENFPENVNETENFPEKRRFSRSISLLFYFRQGHFFSHRGYAAALKHRRRPLGRNVPVGNREIGK
jgi:hypothetical protein